MKGITYLTDESGKRTGVVLDLKRHRRLWEDVYDRLLVHSRKKEPRETLAQVKRRLARQAGNGHA